MTNEAATAPLAQALFVDDSAAEIRLVTELLNRARVQFDGHWVSSGEDALSFLRNQSGFEKAPRPDIIFLDLNLPRMSGTQVLKTIQADQALSSIPVVIVSGTDFEDDVEAARDNGAAHYLVKPLDQRKLADTVAIIDTLKLEKRDADWHLVRA